MKRTKQESAREGVTLSKLGAAALGIFTVNSGPSKAEVRSTLDDARQSREALQRTLEHAREVEVETQRLLAQARAMSSGSS